MSTPPVIETQERIPDISLRELTVILLKEKGIDSGLWDLSITFQLAAGAFGPSPDQVLPATLIGVSGVALQKVVKAGPHTIDASTMLPAQGKAS